MSLHRRIRPGVIALALVVALPMVATVHAATPSLSPVPTSTSFCPGDVLYVGDAGDNTVKVFCSWDGRYLSTIASPSNPLAGPRGLLALTPDPFGTMRSDCLTAAATVPAPALSRWCGDERLLIANQNVNQPINGEINQYGTMDGLFLGALVPPTAPNAPSPRPTASSSVRTGTCSTSPIRATVSPVWWHGLTSPPAPSWAISTSAVS